MTRPTVTAVGRMLQPKGDEPQVWERIKVTYHPDGTRSTWLYWPGVPEGLQDMLEGQD